MAYREKAHGCDPLKQITKFSHNIQGACLQLVIHQGMVTF